MKRPNQKNQLVNRIRFAGAMDKQLYNLFDELHKQTRIPKNQLYDEAIKLLLEKYKDKL